jgi:hypothetical protein
MATAETFLTLALAGGVVAITILDPRPAAACTNNCGNLSRQISCASCGASGKQLMLRARIDAAKMQGGHGLTALRAQ